MRLLADPADLAVMGFVEVLGRLPFFFKLQKKVYRTLDRERVDLVVPIDYPGFNLRLSRRAKQSGIPVLYYIAPQVWAWHASRVKLLARDADGLAVILPFEEAFFRDAGVSATFVGHPLLDSEPPGEPFGMWAAKYGLDPRRPVLALLPGSRAQEVQRHLGLFSEAARQVVAQRPDVQPVIVAAPGMGAQVYRAEPWPRLPHDAHVLHHATAALVKSGTSTLEAALASTPCVVAYRMNPLSYKVARRLVKVPHIALANLIAEERVAAELVQDDASPTALAEALMPLLDPAGEAHQRALAGWHRVRARLGEPGAAERVVDLAAELLEAKGNGRA